MRLWVLPEHVNRTTMATPDGNMDSEVMQIGNCNIAGILAGTYEPYIFPLYWNFHGRGLR